ncbi:hypothetical protein [Pseudoclavibacter sp. VKM Ac-2888]|uniref:hypothetical protein n=1 Tax=Pseudoclavibacter sp. VKM Ac-2888 TaxID=2783830 RepID=UPI00188D5B88|nr:hypothetical protein [Pseudoclavibacter sp. VKM Ac-2888]MBF4549702.1 hypothetical protein [Pseudoclavibacter sp. VKM Ac-2888]
MSAAVLSHPEELQLRIDSVGVDEALGLIPLDAPLSLAERIERFGVNEALGLIPFEAQA